MDKPNETKIENSPPAVTRSIEEEELEENETEEELEEKTKETQKENLVWVIASLIFLVSLAVRLFYLFHFTDPQNANYGWYGDVYHHWQIAYLSKEVGFSHGFLRLWDLKGMEYFWGLAYPLINIFLFTITRSIDIVLVRILSIVSGALTASLVFILVKRYFNFQAALAAALFMAFMPVILFSDTTGMQESFGLALIFGALVLWPKNAFWTGVLWAIASMVRAEYWVFTAALVVIVLIRGRSINRGIALLAGWGGPILLYMKYLLDHTGNPIYPVYWNYLASVSGRWFEPTILSREVLQIKFLFKAAFVVFSSAFLLTVWRRPKYYLLFLFGFANLTFISFVMGFGAYLNGYLPRFWVDRLFLWPYGFLGVLLAILLLFVIPKYLKIYGTLIGWVAFLAILIATQLVWQPIEFYRQIASEPWPKEKVLAAEIRKYYRGGAILLPEDRPALTYALARFEGISGKNMVGQMFDAFYYIKGDAFDNWPKNREIVLNWLKKENIRLIVVYQSRDRYQKLVEREPKLFDLVDKPESAGLDIYRLK